MTHYLQAMQALEDHANQPRPCPRWCTDGHTMIAGTSDSVVSETDPRDHWTHVGPQRSGICAVWAHQVQGEECGEPYIWVCPDSEQVRDPQTARDYAEGLRLAAADLEAIRAGYASSEEYATSMLAAVGLDPAGEQLPNWRAPKVPAPPLICPAWCEGGHSWEWSPDDWSTTHTRGFGTVERVDPNTYEWAVAPDPSIAVHVCQDVHYQRGEDGTWGLKTWAPYVNVDLQDGPLYVGVAGALAARMMEAQEMLDTL